MGIISHNDHSSVTNPSKSHTIFSTLSLSAIPRDTMDLFKTCDERKQMNLKEDVPDYIKAVTGDC